MAAAVKPLNPHLDALNALHEVHQQFVTQAAELLKVMLETNQQNLDTIARKNEEIAALNARVAHLRSSIRQYQQHTEELVQAAQTDHVPAINGHVLNQTQVLPKSELADSFVL